MNAITPLRKKDYSFKKGCGKVSKEVYMILQEDLYKLLGCKTKQHYYRMRNCIPNIAAHAKEAIEAIFAKYGVTDPADIWEITERHEPEC